VRRLCERCRTPDPKGRAVLDEVCARRGLVPPADAALHAPGGCTHCGGSGFRGRIGVFEVMPVDEALTALVRGEPDPLALLRAARAAGMTTMLEDGIAKAAGGLTSLDEVMRMTG
jgi:general secretion pathway protein E